MLHGSGERDLDRMGGLGSRMPVTALAFGVGALGAAALPVTAGFMAEWALLQSLIHGARPEDRLVAVANRTDAFRWLHEHLHDGDVVILENDLPDLYERSAGVFWPARQTESSS